MHLLLAFPLFVVVVGVDSRWLLHSLQQQSKVFHGDKETGPGESAHWQSTPLNYLEIIFQIPFALRPMSQDGFKSMVTELTDSIIDPRPRTDSNPQPGPADKTIMEGVSNGTSWSPDKDPKTEEPPNTQKQTTQAVVNPERLRLEKHETIFMREFAALIETPRAAKRFVNIYRLLRATLDDEELFLLAGDRVQPGRYYQAPVLPMLAILTGYPTEGALLLRNVVNAGDNQYFWDLIALPQQAETANADIKSAELSEKLGALRPAESSDQYLCSNSKTWALKVSRYSFESGQIVH